MNHRRLQILVASSALATAALIGAVSAQQASQAVDGDATRGKPLFSDTFNCYACHGFDAQSGERRLVPLNYTQDGFITFVQNSPLPNMPAFPDATPQQLADIYAYIRTIPADAPAVSDLPLLRDILDRKARAAAD
ncbi:MAG TPA: cytochrome c [Gammaproteobacteria bacterium]|nr:cytochrome c [Gammaproteobacteria bacterium]